MVKVVYIAGPYSAKTKSQRNANVRIAAKIAWQVWKSGNAAICPHLNTFNFEANFYMPELAFEKFLVGDFEIISRCDAVILAPGWFTSKGACAEFVLAKWLKIPVYLYPNVDCSIIQETYLHQRGEHDIKTTRIKTAI